MMTNVPVMFTSSWHDSCR